LTFRRTSAGTSSPIQTTLARTRKSSPDDPSAPPGQELDLLEAISAE
jgi:hypothetical protein